MANLNVQRFRDVDEARAYYLAELDRTSAKLASPTTPAHEAKYREAITGGGPWIAAEAEATGQSAADVADGIIEARQVWESIAIKVEAARIRAKADIRHAQSPAEMHAILQRLR